MATPTTPAETMHTVMSTRTISHTSEIPSVPLRLSDSVLANHAMSKTNRSAAPQSASSRTIVHHFCFASTRYRTQTVER